MNTPEEHSVDCPYCSAAIQLRADVNLGYTIICDRCATPLQVIQVDPPQLDYIWDDEWDGEEWDEDLEDEEEYVFLESEEYELDDWEDEPNGHYN